ncbi:hypothetical protein [Streptomyces yerevanensis]|uniref:hypothetical protein n=1 Tax=Streptomyces yerevanensis TaxID=66378 RepID=UPI0005250CD8|nr:hypothetical protein [Streptomyces yerevanensis]
MRLTTSSFGEDAPMLPEDPPESPARHPHAVPAQPRYTPPTLLQEFRGHPITWSPWKQAPRVTHPPLGCEWCGAPGPPMFAVGLHQSPLIQLHASRCGHCQETWVFEVVDPSPDGLKEIAYYKPKAPANGRST